MAAEDLGRLLERAVREGPPTAAGETPLSVIVMGWLTLSEAGERVDLSAKTLKRRIEEGSLSAEKRPWRGKQEAWMVEVSEFARWAEAEGLSGDALLAGDDPGKRGTAHTDGHGQGPGHGPDDPDLAVTNPDSYPGQVVVVEMKARLAATEAERDLLRERLDELQRDKRFLQETVSNLTTKALPAAQEERDRLAEAAAEARREAEAAERAAAEAREALEAERGRSWWERLLGR